MYKIKKATNRVNSAIDSVKAKPNKAYPINCFAISGFLDALLIREPKTIPIPAPTPARAIRALPAPIIFAASTIEMTQLSMYHKPNRILFLVGLFQKRVGCQKLLSHHKISASLILM